MTAPTTPEASTSAPRDPVVVGILSAVAAAGVAALIVLLPDLRWLMAGIAASLALVITVRNPGVLFATYLLLPFYKDAVQPFSPVDLTPVLAVLCSLQIVPLIYHRRLFHLPRAGVILWAAVTIVFVAGVLYAPDQSIGLARAASFVALVFLPILAAAARVGSRERYLREFVFTFLGFGLVVVILGLAVPSEGDRLTVLGTNTIQTARAALLVPLIVAAISPWLRWTWLRGLGLVFAIAAVFIALATGSRGPIVAVLVIGLIGALRYASRPRGVSARGAAVTIGLTAAAIVLVVSGAIDLPELATARFEGLAEFIAGAASGADSTSSDLSSAARLQFFGAAVTMLGESPVLGLGTAAFEAISSGYLWPAQADAYPHNAVLQVGAEHGLIGIVLAGALALVALSRPIPQGSYGQVVRLLFVFLLINAMFSGNVYEDRQLWGLMMLVAMVDLSARDLHAIELAPAARPGTAGSYFVFGPSGASWTEQLAQAGWSFHRRPTEVLSNRPGPYALPPDATRHPPTSDRRGGPGSRP